MPQRVLTCCSTTVATLVHELGVADSDFPEGAWAYIDGKSLVVRAGSPEQCAQALNSLHRAINKQTQFLQKLRARTIA